jgi:hypothetical protein
VPVRAGWFFRKDFSGKILQERFFRTGKVSQQRSFRRGFSGGLFKKGPQKGLLRKGLPEEFSDSP